MRCSFPCVFVYFLTLVIHSLQEQLYKCSTVYYQNWHNWRLLTSFLTYLRICNETWESNSLLFISVTMSFSFCLKASHKEAEHSSRTRKLFNIQLIFYHIIIIYEDFRIVRDESLREAYWVKWVKSRWHLRSLPVIVDNILVIIKQKSNKTKETKTKKWEVVRNVDSANTCWITFSVAFTSISSVTEVYSVTVVVFPITDIEPKANSASKYSEVYVFLLNFRKSALTSPSPCSVLKRRCE